MPTPAGEKIIAEGTKLQEVSRRTADTHHTANGIDEVVPEIHEEIDTAVEGIEAALAALGRVANLAGKTDETQGSVVGLTATLLRDVAEIYKALTGDEEAPLYNTDREDAQTGLEHCDEARAELTIAKDAAPAVKDNAEEAGGMTAHVITSTEQVRNKLGGLKEIIDRLGANATRQSAALEIAQASGAAAAAIFIEYGANT